MATNNNVGGGGAGAAGGRNSISIESQLLSVGAGFVVFVALLALLATIQRQRRRRQSSSATRLELKSPLIAAPHLSGSLKSNASSSGKVGCKGFRPQRNSHSQSPPTSQLQSPHGSDSSGGSPQCTPMTPYSSFNPTGLHHHQVPNAQAVAAADPGSISLQLQYDAPNTTLQVTILACHDLPELMGSHIGDTGTTASNLNPYVKMRLLPDNQHRVKTRVLRGTRNPFYDETFTMYGISPENIGQHSLYLAVMAFDRYGRDLILGEALYPLTDAGGNQQQQNQKLSTTLKLKARQPCADGEKRGQMLVSMAHNQHSNSVNVAILKCKDLPKDNAIGLMDPYVKVYMLVDGKRVAKHKTHVKKKCRDPVFNESFSFELGSANGNGASAPKSLQSVSFQLVVLNHDGVTRNEVVGEVLVNNQSPLFQQIQAAPGRQIAEWHQIQSP